MQADDGPCGVRFSRRSGMGSHCDGFQIALTRYSLSPSESQTTAIACDLELRGLVVGAFRTCLIAGISACSGLLDSYLLYVNLNMRTSMRVGAEDHPPVAHNTLILRAGPNLSGTEKHNQHVA